MAALNTPPGFTLDPGTLPVADPNVLRAAPVGSNYVLAPATPATGQIWPRGQGA